MNQRFKMVLREVQYWKRTDVQETATRVQLLHRVQDWSADIPYMLAKIKGLEDENKRLKARVQSSKLSRDDDTAIMPPDQIAHTTHPLTLDG